jgi:hypothetical protein
MNFILGNCVKTHTFLQIDVFKLEFLRFLVVASIDYRHRLPSLAFFPTYRPMIYLSMTLQPLVEPWPPFQFLYLFTQAVGLLGRRSVRRKTATYTQNKRTQTSVPEVGFEHTIPVFERAKTVHALDRARSL